MNPLGPLLIGAGLFSIVCAAANWDFFINNRKAKLFVAILGRNGARVFYVILGILITVLGVLMTMGVIRSR